MKVNFRLNKVQYFNGELAKKLDKATFQVLSKFGAYVRRSAKSSLKKAAQKPKAQLTAEELEGWERRQEEWAMGRLSEKPRRPDKVSKPGDPPLLHSTKSPLKRIEFAYSAKERAVVVGPIGWGSNQGDATEALEYGGTTRDQDGSLIKTAPRPYMVPAHEKNLQHLREWRDAMR